MRPPIPGNTSPSFPSALPAWLTAAVCLLSCGTSETPDATSDTDPTGSSGTSSTSEDSGETEPATSEATGTSTTGGICSDWADWECSPFGSACRASCAADDSRSILCDPSGRCIFRTGSASSQSCQNNEPLSEEKGCESCKAAVAAGCF